MKKHIVRRGEWIGQIASHHGLRGWSSVWVHPANAELRALRGEASLLMEGDVLFIPGAGERGTRVATNRRLTFQVVPADHVRLRIGSLASFIEEYGPVAYTARAGDREVTGTLTEDKQGVLVPIRRDDRAVTVEVLGRTLTFSIGDVGPASEPCGAYERLRHLGYASDDPDNPVDARTEIDNERLELALRAFQRATGLEPTGALDKQTQHRLAEAYGT